MTFASCWGATCPVGFIFADIGKKKGKRNTLKLPENFSMKRKGIPRKKGLENAGLSKNLRTERLLYFKQERDPTEWRGRKSCDGASCHTSCSTNRFAETCFLAINFPAAVAERASCFKKFHPGLWRREHGHSGPVGTHDSDRV